MPNPAKAKDVNKSNREKEALVMIEFTITINGEITNSIAETPNASTLAATAISGPSINIRFKKPNPIVAQTA